MQTDIRKCCKGGLLPREIVSGGHTGTFPGPLILQVLSITNAAQPSTRQHVTEGNTLLSVRLTDGAMKCQAMEYASVPKLRWVLVRPTVVHGIAVMLTVLAIYCYHPIIAAWIPHQAQS